MHRILLYTSRIIQNICFLTVNSTSLYVKHILILMDITVVTITFIGRKSDHLKFRRKEKRKYFLKALLSSLCWMPAMKLLQVMQTWLFGILKRPKRDVQIFFVYLNNHMTPSKTDPEDSSKYKGQINE